jgi:phosphohistidine swiveling domain-containing protein
MSQYTNPINEYILPLNSENASIPTAGGKGASLARMAVAGLPVPDGFIITTQAYEDYISANQLEERILQMLPGDSAAPAEELEAASSQIRSLFADGILTEWLSKEIQVAYAAIGRGPVAVRSSATAEDLPEMSFAGQQDTFLNILGESSLLKAVVDCWSSLWTARAIGYRARNHVPQQGLSLAVVVQKMVESQVSGVLFTANPVTGLRTETVIDAAYGLGEALVSGQVEPDHYVVDAQAMKIVSKTLGKKELSIHGKENGGTQRIVSDRQSEQALSDEVIIALTALGQKTAALYSAPQDIEWAYAGGQLFLLQSRPITTLYPLPADLPAEPLKVMFSFAAVQGMLDPITPVGADALRFIFAMAAGLFGMKRTSETPTGLYSAGERLWVNFTTILRNSFGRRVVPVVLDLVEPTIRQAVISILDDPHLQPGKAGISLKARLQLARFFLPTGASVLLNLAAPRWRRQFIVHKGERVLAELDSLCAEIHGNRGEKLFQVADLLNKISARRLPATFRLFVSGVASGMASWNLLRMLTADAVISDDPGFEKVSIPDLVLQVTRGMPYNPTTEMDLALWEMAKHLHQDEESKQVIQHTSAESLAEHYLANELPQPVLQAISTFLCKYGGRGLGEIDLGRNRWAEDPTHVFEMLGSFMHIKDESMAPDVIFTRGAGHARQAVDKLASLAGRSRQGWIKKRLVRFLAGRARQLMGLRENPKFFAVRMMYLVHRELLKVGKEFTAAGELDKADDLFYLTFAEMRIMANDPAQDWHSLIAGRRTAYHRELLRRQVPRLLLSDGRAFYEGINTYTSDEHILTGSPVSPGSAEGNVRVVLNPGQAHLLPGEIMVCPGTDPSWTPLFLTAGGLVLETGGMMTHGAVVAREYGIPAIVGVDKATLRLKTGQRIRIDGSTGQILILNEEILT